MNFLHGNQDYIGKLKNVHSVAVRSGGYMTLFEFEDDRFVGYSDKFPDVYKNRMEEIALLFYPNREAYTEVFVDAVSRIVAEARPDQGTWVDVYREARVGVLKELIGLDFIIECREMVTKRHKDRTYTVYKWSRDSSMTSNVVPFFGVRCLYD